MRAITKVSIIVWVMGLPAVTAPAENVALHATVKLQGSSFFDGQEAAVSAETLVDGLFFPRHHQWNSGTVWWSWLAGEAPYIEVDLGGVFEISGFTVQADDNDAYMLSYRDLESGSWQVIWDIPNYDTFPWWYNWGLQARPNPDDHTEIHQLETPIITDALRLEGHADDSDLYFAVSEIQAFGQPPSAEVTIACDPDRLNLRSRGRWITCYLTPPDGHDVSELDVETILLEDAFEVQRSAVQGDVLMLKFDRQALLDHLVIETSLISSAVQVDLDITGQLLSGQNIQGSAAVTVE